MYTIPGHTLFVGKNLVQMPSCESTNEWAIRLAQTGNAVEGTVVITSDQTQGKGQRGNVWISQPGSNLTFSLVLRPSFLAPVKQFQVTQAVSLGVRDCVASLSSEEVTVKWPNDVMIGDKKVSGILIENQLRGNEFVFTVVGIGLNVNQVVFPFDSATSLSLSTGREYALPEVLNQLLLNLEHRYLMLRAGRENELNQHYHEVLYGRGIRRRFQAAHATFEGTITGVDPLGRLLIESEGQVRCFQNKEIEYIR